MTLTFVLHLLRGVPGSQEHVHLVSLLNERGGGLGVKQSSHDKLRPLRPPSQSAACKTLKKGRFPLVQPWTVKAPFEGNQ